VTDRGFTCHEQVGDVHLIHMGGSGLRLSSRRFLSVDPFVVEPRDMQSLNAYSYVRNNPTGRVDPTGAQDPPHPDKASVGARSWLSPLRDPREGELFPQDQRHPDPGPGQGSPRRLLAAPSRAGGHEQAGQAWPVISADEKKAPDMMTQATRGPGPLFCGRVHLILGCQGRRRLRILLEMT
jgi:RHS repeat-associated protein